MHCKWQFICYEIQYNDAQQEYPAAQLFFIGICLLTYLYWGAICCVFRTNEPGMEVLELTPNPNKLCKLTRGPFVIQRVHYNGTITIHWNAKNRINIRIVRLFWAEQPQDFTNRHS
jgi:hypothetical protein